MVIPKLELKKEYYKVFKIGIPFYDAARLIGTAHLFFGTASAEVEDKGAYWEINGIDVKRDEKQIAWAIERLNPFNKERELFYQKDTSQWDLIHEYFSKTAPTNRNGRCVELKAEYDATLQIGTRGLDPLAKYEVLAPRSTGETRKKFKDYFPEVAAATLGRAFAARVTSRTKRQTDEMYLLPTFKERFVLSSFVDYSRFFSHSGGGRVAAVLASLSILLDLTGKRLPVTDFVYTKEVKGPTRFPIFSTSGYLGLERLCNMWWSAVQENDNTTLTLLREFRSFLSETSRPITDEQVQSLARWVADFIANPNVDALIMIERLKSRILAASQNQNKNISGAFSTNRLLNKSEIIKEVGKMIESDLPEIPWQVSEALGKALALDEKGWMNQFTRLENAGNFAQFIQQVEHIVSRGYYREQQEKGQQLNIRSALTGAREIANRLRETSNALQNNDKTFRTFKAIFLLDVLSRQRVRLVHTEQTSALGSVSQNVTQT